MSEIITTQPLCWILDNEWIKHYKECSLEDLQQARMQKVDILTASSEVLTDYPIAKYWKADVVDRFLFFALPKYPAYIQKKFKMSVANMGREQRNSLTYDAISQAIKRWIHEEQYYS